MGTLPTYATREAVKAAAGIASDTARTNAQIDRVLGDVSRDAEALCHRTFYPHYDTKTFDWPSQNRSRPWRLWLDEHELISASLLVSGGTTIVSADYFLEPNASGPPYNRVEIDLASSASFQSGDTSQRAIAVTGLYGYRDDQAPAGALAEALDDSETEVQVTDAGLIGVGDLLTVGAERLVVTGRALIATGATVAADITDRNNDRILTITPGSTPPVAGEMITVGAERLLVEDVTGVDLVVQRVQDGSVLQAHVVGDAVYAPRALTVERGAVGSTAATHLTATAVTRWQPPAVLQGYVLAAALVQLDQEGTRYARTVGSGENQRETSGRGLAQKRDRLYAALARQARTGAI